MREHRERVLAEVRLEVDEIDLLVPRVERSHLTLGLSLVRHSHAPPPARRSRRLVLLASASAPAAHPRGLARITGSQRAVVGSLGRDAGGDGDTTIERRATTF